MYQWMIKVFLCLLISTPLFAADFIVKYKDAGLFFSQKSVQSLNIVDTHEDGNLIKVEINDKNPAAQLAELMANPQVEYVVKNFRLHKFDAPIHAAALKEQWANNKVNIDKAWQLAGNKGSKKIIVAVIDTGVDYRHKALSTNMVQGYDFKDNDSDPMDETGARNPGHGTHCSGSIAANGNIDGGVVGASPVLSLMPLRFLGADGSGDLMAGIKAIDHAIKNGAHIISASWGATVGRSQAQPLVDAVKRADDAGVIFIAAAANDGKNNDKTEVYPANAGFPNTITVAASNVSDAKPSWSNYGKKTVHLSSPGENIMSTIPGDKYQNLSGTSMATPLVSGIVALLKAQNEDLTGAEVRALLQHTGSSVQINTACDCRVDAGNAMESLLNQKMFTVPATATIAINDTMKFAAKFGQAPFQFTTDNANIATIAADGTLTGKAEGQVKVFITDANGKKAESLAINVGAVKEDNPGGGGECPLGDQALCDMLCQFQPDLPFCTL